MRSEQLLAVMATAAGLGTQAVAAIDLDIRSVGSIKSAAAAVAGGAMKYYNSNQPDEAPGTLPEPYYWWQSAVMFNVLVDYGVHTGDSTYNEPVNQAILHQRGPDNNFQPSNQSSSLTNDDQAMWALTALSAAEFSFGSPPAQLPWVDLSKNAFERQVSRWEDGNCGGGLKWTVYSFQRGHTYSNTLSNGAFFELSSRLARYTKEEKYLEWAVKAWDWMSKVGLVTEDFKVFDGTDREGDCKEVNRLQWSINTAFLLSGAANLYNATNEDSIWKSRVDGLLKGADIFFKDDIMIEPACEATNKCNIDQKTYKAILSRALGTTTQLAPFTRDAILPKIRASATAAAEKCMEKDGVAQCSFKWVDKGSNDNTKPTLGEQLAALQIIQANLVAENQGRALADSPGSGENTGGGFDGAPTDGALPTSPSPGAASSVMDLRFQRLRVIMAITGLPILFGVVL
ncbi:hypothetical protein AJ79_02510 [Helicocarpus griseus UAMH5409]|uniref:Mannan endo-1,6-alpha-mannosidase n=1 Tax=Helicocarpus griseus UAMH5409 TaxID=1447875 RepID=A0A2B7XUA2_9EURO|nr:hypothetical protein AJ79_02510 [Helicocarpus griseus UAMH5409]